jgi:hypothetical protein
VGSDLVWPATVRCNVAHASRQIVIACVNTDKTGAWSWINSMLCVLPFRPNGIRMFLECPSL